MTFKIYSSICALGVRRIAIFFAVFISFTMIALEEDLQKGDKKYTLAICAVFKNEEKSLREWIEYHQLIGVDHFYLYNVASKDKSLRILAPYISQGLVTLINWYDLPNQQQDDTTWSLALEIPAYQHAIKYKAIQDSKWIIFLDTHEFLVPQGNKIIDVLEKYKECSGIVLKRDYFDASKANFPESKLVIQAVTLSETTGQSHERSVEKTILKPEDCEAFSWPPFKCKFKAGGLVREATRSELRVNRYVQRSFSDSLFRKTKNKLYIDANTCSEGEVRELLNLGYEIEDQERAIYHFVPELLKRMGYSTGWEW